MLSPLAKLSVLKALKKEEINAKTELSNAWLNEFCCYWVEYSTNISVRSSQFIVLVKSSISLLICLVFIFIIESEALRFNYY